MKKQTWTNIGADTQSAKRKDARVCVCVSRLWIRATLMHRGRVMRHHVNAPWTCHESSCERYWHKRVSPLPDYKLARRAL